jgi:hypothetical protein
VARYNGDPVGVNEASTAHWLAVSPIPFTSELHVSAIGTGEVVLIDAMGKEVLRQKTATSDTRINTAHLPPGLYLVRYVDGPGDGIATTQVVKM